MKIKILCLTIALLIPGSGVPQTPVRAVFALNSEATGSISGHIYKADGMTPISGASVMATRVDSNPPYVYPDPGAIVTSGADGSYIFPALSTGKYRIKVYSEGYIREFYNGVYYSSKATLVSVTAPSYTPNIDFTLDIGGTISGHVYKADGTSVLSNARVEVEPNDGDYSVGANADSSGRYTIKGLPSGKYRVYARYGEGYLAEFYNGAFYSKNATLVSVTAPIDTPNIDFTLDRTGSISGHVYKADGVTPLPNATVSFYRQPELGHRPPIPPAITPGPNADGSYTIGDLPPGNYHVYARASGYVTEYYGGSYFYDGAVLVPVTLSSNTPNIDFKLDSKLDVGGSISGHVFKTDGTPLSEVGVYANLIQGGFGDSIFTGSDGSYTINGLVPGSYKVSVSTTGYSMEYYNSAYFPTLATPVQVTDHNNTPTIDFTLDTTGSISGYVYQADNITPIPNVRIEAFDASTKQSSNGIGTDVFGHYVLPNVPAGNYLIRASSSSNYIAEWYGNSYGMDQSTLVTVNSSADTPNINFNLSTGKTISGYVYQTDNISPIENAYVRVYGLDNNVYGGASTAIDGSYTTGGLPPGNYKVRAEPYYYGSKFYDNANSIEQAATVTITGLNDIQNINFNLALDATPPSVTGIAPASNSVGIPVNTTVQVTFSESMNMAATAWSFLITPPTRGSFSWAGNTLTFYPIDNLARGASYTVILGTMRDTAGNQLPLYTWSFATVSDQLVQGDANNDNLVDASDITKVERIIARLDAVMPGADANQDGKVNAVDITKIERLVAGLN